MGCYHSTGDSCGWACRSLACDQQGAGIVVWGTTRRREGQTREEGEGKREGADFVQSGLIAIAGMFAVRLDAGNCNAGEGSEVVLCPENWAAVCYALKRFSEAVSADISADRAEKMLQMFIKLLSVHISGRLWPVTEQVLVATSKAICAATSMREERCYCAKAPFVAARFASVSMEADGARLKEELKTACECVLLLGWRYAQDQEKGGNVMKRVMTVVKNVALFTSGSSGHAVKHYVGLMLTMGDRLCSSSKNGKYLLCRMLTSECASLEAVAEHVATFGGDNGLGWNAMMEAICTRQRGEAADGDAQERGQDAGDEGEPRVAAGAGLDLLQRGDEDVCNGSGHWRRAEAQDRRGRRGRGRQRAGSGGADGGAAAGVHGEEAACGSRRAAAGARGGAAHGAGGAQGVRRRAARLGGGAGDRRDAHCARARARARGRARGRARERRVGAGGEAARRRDGGAAELHAMGGRGAAARRARRGGVHGAVGAPMQAGAGGVRRRRRRRTPTCGSLTRAAPCGRSRGARALDRARAARAATAAAGGRRRAGGGGAARGRARAQRARF
ncbi:hypothetical protein FGB62_345g05 [Gracilaria domingensis]|nr:hypothetical protein FGB62_345g05 [Gracilaria domingensis]